MSILDIDDLKLEKIKQQLAEYVMQGLLDRKLIQLLVSDGRCMPVECELLDYKQELGEERRDKGNAVLQIVSFYNTYGGYLVYGVAERAPETEFEVIGIAKDSIDVESLKALAKEYTGERINICLQYFSIDSGGSAELRGDHIAALYIPKRNEADDPLAFGKDGPGNEKNHPLFYKEDVYYRKGDECILAKGKAVLLLAGPRECPYKRGLRGIDKLLPRRTRLEHNLPDRNVICTRFVGRRNEIDQLWSWFADEFSHVRVLAGEGGLGKTSIAYQFAEEVCTASESETRLERVIWLTAKREQFSGIQNETVAIPETHFSTHIELLRELSVELGHTSEEIEGASEARLKKLIKEGAAITPSLIILDDIDSLTPEEQKRALEIGFLFGGAKSRLLLTTRVNQSYSDEIAIQVGGFDLDDYTQYVRTLSERYSFVALSSREIEEMHKVTGGSPLFTESLCRLMRYTKLSGAIREWRGKGGEEARAAALQREIEQLSQEAKRVLLAAAHLQECSLTELSETTGYAEPVLSNSVTELRSIYLLSAPQVTSEPRVRVGPNTRMYVLNLPSRLAADYSRIEGRVKDLRGSAKQLRMRKDNPLVGAAINQASAQFKKGAIDDALATIVAAEKRIKGNVDLLVMQAYYLLKLTPAKPDEARRLARAAYDAGGRKEFLFQVWYEAEWAVDNYAGAAEAADCAIRNEEHPTSDLLIRRAAATWFIAKDQERNGNIDRAIADYWAVAMDLKAAENLVPKDELAEIRQQVFVAHDAIWDLLCKADRTTVDVPVRAIDEILKMTQAGDVRIPVCLKYCEALKWLNQVVDRGVGPIKKGMQNLAEQQYRRVNDNLHAIATQRRGDNRFGYVIDQFREVEGKFQKIGARRGSE